jgi:YidC/Oxa1 family membrane protein insertase
VKVVDTSTAVDALDTPAVVESIPSDLTETLISSVPAALQYGDMAALGLAGWSPAGWVRWSMELINVSTGIPWFWTIIAGSAIWRLLCVPFAIKGFQVSAQLMPLQPQLKELQKAVTKSKQSQNPLELQRASQALTRFYKAHNIHPLTGLVSMVQLPITFGLFFGLQKMCNLPLEQLTHSGVAFLPDLTASDPTMILPLVMFVLVNAQIRVSLPDYNFFLLKFYSCFITAFNQRLQYGRATLYGASHECTTYLDNSWSLCYEFSTFGELAIWEFS